MSKQYEKLKGLLETLFQLDQADLDFGIYRIMNQKRDEVVRFLEKDLLPQVKEAFQQYQSADKVQLQKELDKAIEQANNLGVDPETTTKVRDLREQIADSSVDVTALENEVYSHLFSFFRRYYHEGDFISLRRYKEGVYAIPYEGEEVKLHWANHDQYYVKSSEYFRDYIFTLPGGKRVRVHLVAASTEQDNKKEAPGKDRRFVICEEDPIYEENGELFIRFEYRPENGDQRQDTLNRDAIQRVLSADGFDDWVHELSKPAPTKSNPNRTVIEKHLTQYTARNTFDYFIHKDLGGFLRRELDFYIKNEVMHLDDIEHDTVPRVEQYLSKIKVIRKIAHLIIQFLEQLENFQKKLWLKKKFVVETNYCITLDRVPEELYPEIASNDAQREEWVQLFAIDNIENSLHGPGYSKPLTVEFLKHHAYLPLDTRLFSIAFRDALVASLESQVESLTAVLLNSENFQALRFAKSRFSEVLDSIYIDPPYNTDASAILYKNDYKHSSWLSLIYGRIAAGKKLLRPSGVMCVAIDDIEFPYLKVVLESAFDGNVLGIAAVRSNPSGRSTPTGMSIAHDYALFVGKSEFSVIGRLPRSEKQLARYGEKDENGPFEWVNFRKHGGADAARQARPRMFYPLFAKEGSIRIPKMSWNERKREWLLEESPSDREEVIWPTNTDGDEKRWKWGVESVQEKIGEFCARPDQNKATGVYLKARMKDEGMFPITWWDSKEYSATEYGTNLLTDILGKVGLFSFPKALSLVENCLRAAALSSEGWVADFFAGSGTTGHAVLDLNRSDGGQRRFMLVEMGQYFDSVLKPRILKAGYCSEWRKGKPVNRDTGLTQIIKYMRLESYEDALNNLELKRTDQQASLLEQDDDLRAQYILSYMLDVETKDSQSLLNIDSFRNPDQYKLRVERNGETQLVNVDLVETFNWLLGLAVKHIDVIQGVRVVEGMNPSGERVLVLWRNLDATDNDALDAWFQKQGYNTRDQEYDLIYVNGDNNLENLRRGDQTWKVRLTEEEFQRLMFDVEDV